MRVKRGAKHHIIDTHQISPNQTLACPQARTRLDLKNLMERFQSQSEMQTVKPKPI